jgi:formylglycine-generating enzyme required for sulfatase activity
VPESPFVFISFASADADLAHRAVATLERAGIRCWIADRDIRMAASYPAAITAAIKGSGALLLLLTEHANGSPHVQREVELAFTSRRPILPVRIAGVMPSSDLQYFLSASQWLDAGTAFDDEDLTKIEPVLKDLLQGRRFSGEITAGWPPWMRPVVGAALVVVAAAGAWLWFNHRPRATELPAGQPGRAAVESPPPENVPTVAINPTPAPAAAGTNRPASKVNPRDGQTYLWIPPGRFVMGCSDGDPACESDEKPTHDVQITRGFWLARSEVTDGQSTMPQTAVTWAAAKAYCSRIGGRLPTEAEWEYAARAGSRSRYYGTPDAIAWFAANSDERAHPVATKTPNAFGLYDMLGNVSEWVVDRYYNAYDDSSDPLKPDQPLAGNASGVARGGSWTSEATGVRVSRRLEVPPDATEPHIGFRCALDSL